MFTAIVLDSDSQNKCIKEAIALGILPLGHPAKCHHVTLAMGAHDETYAAGAARNLTVTHYGVTKGRVAAFRVSGASDSRNKVPHVTVAVFGDAKPKESNDITVWKPLEFPFEIFGTVKICR